MLTGKTALVTGVANEHSLAWHIAERLYRDGASIGLSYQNERLEKRVKRLAQRIDAVFVEPCDVTNDAELDALFVTLWQHWTNLDILVHAIAYADIDVLQRDLSQVSRQHFQQAFDTSVYSLLALTAHAKPLLQACGGAVITLSYYGAHKVVPQYHLMGMAKAALESAVRYLAAELGPAAVRVNAISPGPIKTLSTAALPRLNDKLQRAAINAPLGTAGNGADVSAMAAFLVGEGGRHITGTTFYTDGGLHILGDAQ